MEWCSGSSSRPISERGRENGMVILLIRSESGMVFLVLFSDNRRRTIPFSERRRPFHSFSEVEEQDTHSIHSLRGGGRGGPFHSFCERRRRNRRRRRKRRTIPLILSVDDEEDDLSIHSLRTGGGGYGRQGGRPVPSSTFCPSG